MSVKINKNGKEYDLGFIPEHYPADRVTYVNTESGLSATDAQGAIDEVNGKITNVSEVINVNGTTDQYGQINITASIPVVSGSTFVLSTSNKFVNMVAIYGSVVTIRYRNINDGSSVANTSIVDKVMLITSV